MRLYDHGMQEQCLLLLYGIECTYTFIYTLSIYPYVYNMKFGNKWPYLEDILLI